MSANNKSNNNNDTVDRDGDDEDADDYMSDALLHKAEDIAQQLKRQADTGNDYRKRRREAQHASEAADRAGQSRPLKEQIESKRDAGLATPLASDNKGFQLLAKMGFKQGSSLGARGNGLTEPLPLNVKQERSGVGAMTAAREASKVAEEEQRTRLAKLQQDSERNKERFVQNMSTKYSEQQTRRDVEESRLVAEQLDRENTVSDNELWLTRNRPNQPVDADGRTLPSSFDELPPGEQLSRATVYLRERYHFCVWCGIAYTSSQELDSSCPGPTSNDH